MNDVHDPYDPNSPAYDLQQGSIETMEMIDPIPIIIADAADLPDDPNQLSAAMADPTTTVGIGIQEMLAHGGEHDHCSDPEHDERVDDAREGGYV